MQRRSVRIAISLCLLSLVAAAPSPSSQAFPTTVGTTLHVVFVKPIARPGVRLMELTRTANGWKGQLVSDWYGTMPMSNIVLHGRSVRFDIRNINVRDMPTRRWTATSTAAGVILTGGIWDQEVRQTGQPASAGQAASLTPKDVPLPSLGHIAPDGLAATPPMGWSSWNKFAEHIDDRTIRAMADAMVSSGLRDAGYEAAVDHVPLDWILIIDSTRSRAADITRRDMLQRRRIPHPRGLRVAVVGPRGTDDDPVNTIGCDAEHLCFERLAKAQTNTSRNRVSAPVMADWLRPIRWPVRVTWRSA